jgi:hypothetical protein
MIIQPKFRNFEIPWGCFQLTLINVNKQFGALGWTLPTFKCDVINTAAVFIIVVIINLNCCCGDMSNQLL